MSSGDTDMYWHEVDGPADDWWASVQGSDGDSTAHQQTLEADWWNSSGVPKAEQSIVHEPFPWEGREGHESR